MEPAYPGRAVSLEGEYRKKETSWDPAFLFSCGGRDRQHFLEPGISMQLTGLAMESEYRQNRQQIIYGGEREPAHCPHT
jgi:hypothetical protein